MTASHNSEPPVRITVSKISFALLSLFAVVHILAVVAEPLRFASQTTTPRGAPHATLLRRGLAPYIDMMYLSHGYFFFAPNPGPSHLVACVFNDAQANQSANENGAPERVVYPDKRLHKPRLLYHRYFMFTEFYNSLFVPLDMPDSVEGQGALPDEGLQRSKALYKALNDSLRKHLEWKFPERRFQIYRVEHLLPDEFQHFEQGWKLDDDRLYRELPESIDMLEQNMLPGAYRFDDLGESPAAHTPPRLYPPVQLSLPETGELVPAEAASQEAVQR